jgi:hypothetical protein
MAQLSEASEQVEPYIQSTLIHAVGGTASRAGAAAHAHHRIAVINLNSARDRHATTAFSRRS